MRESLLLWFLSRDLFCKFLLYSSHRMPKVFQTLNCSKFYLPISPDILLVYADKHILRLDVGVDDLALGVQVVQPFKHLLHHDLHIGQVDPLVVASDDEFEQVMTQHL